MTLSKQVKKSTKKKRNSQQVNGQATPLKNRTSITEAAILPGIVPVKMSKDPPPPPPAVPLKQESEGKQETAEPTIGPKLERKPSLRRKLSSLLRGSADLPAAINRGLQPIRRSMSFSKGIEQKPPPQPPTITTTTTPKNSAFKAFRTRSVQWYNSLSSLAENDETKGHLANSEERIFHEDDVKQDTPGARMVREFGINFHIFLEDILALMVCVGLITKLIAASKFENNRKKVYDMVFNHIETIRDKEEVKVLQEHYDYGLRYSFIYTGVLVLMAILFNCFAIGKVISDYITGESDLLKVIPFYVEYFVDEQKNYFYIMFHILFCFVACFVVDFAFDCTFIMQIQHACALFKIVTMRLEKTSINEIESDVEIYDPTTINAETHKSILSAIKLHLEVLEMVNSIEEAYNVCWFIVLVENMVGFGACLYLLYTYSHDFIEVAKYLTAFVTVCIHFRVIFSQGQIIIDSSSSVFDACYNCPWYNWNKHLRKILIIIMARSRYHSEITGGSVFVISMETYGKMLKTGFSCYAICKMREDYA